MMRIYLAGGMTGYPDLNFPLFHSEAARLRAHDQRFRLHPYVKDEIGGFVRVRITKSPEKLKE